MAHQIAQHAANGALAFELLKNEPQHRLRLFIGVFDHVAGETTDIAHGHLHPQFAPPGFGLLTGPQPLFEDVQFCLRHGPLESENESVVIIPRVVDPIKITNQGAKQGADFQQWMPVTIGAGQARHLYPQDDPYVI
jgi:hypothetical protein